MLNGILPNGECLVVVGVAQMVEHQIVVLGVAGSNPVAHPINEQHKFTDYFTRKESGRSAVGSALALGARGRQFESDRPDHFDQSHKYRARSSAG